MLLDPIDAIASSVLGATKRSAVTALRAGFRLLDCAERYRNEEAVGDAMQEVFAGGSAGHGTAPGGGWPTPAQWALANAARADRPAFGNWVCALLESLSGGDADPQCRAAFLLQNFAQPIPAQMGGVSELSRDYRISRLRAPYWRAKPQACRSGQADTFVQ